MLGAAIDGVSADGWSKAASQLTAGADAGPEEYQQNKILISTNPRALRIKFGSPRVVRSFERTKFGKDGIYL